MNRNGVSILLSVVLLAATPLRSQEPMEGANVFGDLSPARMDPIFESRKAAQQQLAAHSDAFKTPNIAGPLEWPPYLIAIARIVSVQFPTGDNPRTQIGVRVERFLRGQSKLTDFVVESRWDPMAPPIQEREPKIDFGNLRLTALDLSEPKVGRVYILGYRFDHDDGQPIFVPGVIDLQDPKQAKLRLDVERFLALESNTTNIGTKKYIDAMDDETPWIRDIAVHRLTSFPASYLLPDSPEIFLAILKRRLQSDSPNERLEALSWLVWADSVARDTHTESGHEDGLPILPDSAIRRLLSSAIEDANPLLGDFAFQFREMFDMYRAGTPGECYEIVPALRKSAHWRSGQHDILPVGFPVSYSYGCIPPQASVTDPAR